MSQTSDIERAVPPRAFFPGHPPGLGILFFTELWERFSFYGMRALLIFYLTEHLLFTDREAYALYGAYTALVYIGPLFGGYLADRYFGARRAVMAGAILLALGHFAMALEGPAALAIEDPAFGREIIRDALALETFYLALALIIAGEAFLKPNISTLVGRLYAPGDRRRDAGFTYFYMGINIGAFAATLLCGYLGQRFGWAYGFGLAGLGMLSGLLVFWRGLAVLGSHGDPPDPRFLTRRLAGPVTGAQSLGLAALLTVLAGFALIRAPAMVGGALAFLCAAAGLGLIAFALLRCAPETRDRLIVSVVHMAFAVIFFALFEQAGSSLNLFADRILDRDLGAFTIEAAQLQSLNPLFVIALAPLFARLWTELAQRAREPSTPHKFAAGLLLIGMGFAALALGIATAGTDAKVALLWFVVSIFLQTMGELALSPIGLSMVTKLSPGSLVGLTMGVWFLATAAAQYVAALLASSAAIEVSPDGSFDRQAALADYGGLYLMLAGIAVAAALLLFALAPLLRRRMHGAE